MFAQVIKDGCFVAALSAVQLMLPGLASAETKLIDTPSGTYTADANHTTLAFKVGHIGLSTYVARFIGVESTIALNADDPTQSHVELTVDPLSIKADYAGDYSAIYPDSTFAGWDEHLAKHENFFQADTFPEISFVSTSIEPTGDNTGIVKGELTMLGKTLPLDMDVTFNGALAQHPFIPGYAVVGFSATGTVKRSDYGMTFLLEPPFVTDEVMIEFETEYLMPNAS
ncbi:YceI family protein [Yoonia sp. SS1-5]|uniref:YceI family protein n=1 Tax=Yoonia rhodophyticola TaxID=3137370 RepID=A0AAN0M9N1_9RHOB